jgi:hypothetical protein
LIFTGIGATLARPNARPNAQDEREPVIGAVSFGAVVMMVIITTLVTPPLLKWSIERATLRSEPPDLRIREMGGGNNEHSATAKHPQSGI